VDHRLVHVDRPILRVPNIAIHLHRETNDKLDMNKEKHLSVLHSAASSCTEPQGLCLYQVSQLGPTAANPQLQVCCCGLNRREISIDCQTMHISVAWGGECG